MRAYYDGQEGILATRVGESDSQPAKGAVNPKSLWSVTIPAKFLPNGESVLKAWVYDERERFVKLRDVGNEKRISKK